MNNLPAALQDLRNHCRQMPPVAAMQADVLGFDEDRLRLTAPLAANLNDKGTAFGGSLTSLMTLAGWARVTLGLQLAGQRAEVYVADSQVRYLTPLRSDLMAEAWLMPDAAWDSFLSTLCQRGRARIQVEAAVRLPDGQAAATLSGRFVAIRTQ